MRRPGFWARRRARREAKEAGPALPSVQRLAGILGMRDPEDKRLLKDYRRSAGERRILASFRRWDADEDARVEREFVEDVGRFEGLSSEEERAEALREFRVKAADLPVTGEGA